MSDLPDSWDPLAGPEERAESADIWSGEFWNRMRAAGRVALPPPPPQVQLGRVVHDYDPLDALKSPHERT
jgi:hypothetical protein